MRGYLRAMLASAAAVLLLTLAVNLVVDPFALYGGPRIEGFNALKPGLAGHARLWKTATVAHHSWEALIVGTSRAEIGFDPGHAFFRGRKCFNAALGGQPYEESLALVQAGLAGGKLRQVLLVLDFPVSNAYVPFPDDYAQGDHLHPIALLLSGEALVESLRTVTRQDTTLARRNAGFWLANGRYALPTPGDHRAQARESDRYYVAKNYFPAPSYSHAFAANGRSPLESVRALARIAHARGLDLTIAIAPAHARQWETVAAAGRWPLWEEWKRRLVMINEEEARAAGRPAFPLWDFSGYSALTTEPFPALGESRARMRWYWDSSHFTKEAGDVALDRMSGRTSSGFEDVGVMLAPATVERHLGAIRAGHAAWGATHPDEVAEIHAMAELARRDRESRPRPLSASWP